jgi:YVTN family beta-propeller protein
MKILGPATLVLVFVVRMLSEVAQAQVVPFTSIATGTNPQVDVADTANGKVFVANQGSNTVSVFDPVNWTKITDVATGAGPRRLRINGTTNKLYVVNQSDASVTVISATTNAVVQTITLAASSNPTRSWNR